jgi:PAS domain S-box-containing protein
MWTSVRAQILQWRGIGTIAIGVTAGVLALQGSGALQLLESAVLDQWFRLRPPESGESRLVIVTIDESDISRLGRWPMSDATLAKLLKKLQTHQPALIGLDLYRNLPVEPGHQELLNVYGSMPNLIGIHKALSNTNGSAVEPPPVLRERDQVAASDLVLDADGKVRRHLLSLRVSETSLQGTHYSKTSLTLGLKLALAYLEAQNIKPQSTGKDGILKLGKATFLPLQENEGGYVHADVGGYQILANFQRLRGGFSKISMTDVLEGRIPANLIRGRIVLIGTVAQSLGDRFYTPYTTDVRTAWPGVEIHANLTSQILSAALDGRQLLRGLPEPLEWLWILLWSSTGTVLGWRVRSRSMGEAQSLRWAVIAIPTLSGSLIASPYLLFLAGWWVPLASPFLALVSAGITSRGYLLWKNLQLSHQALENYAQTLELKVHERTKELEEKEQFLRSIYNGVAESIFVVDVLENGEFRYVGLNPAHEQLTAILSTEIQGKTPEQVFPPDVAAVVQQHYRDCVEAGDTITYEECLPFQGKQTWWITSLTPLWNERLSMSEACRRPDHAPRLASPRQRRLGKAHATRSQIYRIIGCSVNISDRKQVESELQQAKEASDAANRAKSAFLASMSHELRTPLNGILGYAQILQGDKNATAKQKEALSIIYRCGMHLLTLINDILDLSKIEAGKLELYLEDVDFSSFLTGVSDIFRLKATQKSIRFTQVALTQLPTVIQTDEKRLRQVLLNLLSNAIKFTDTGSVTFKVGVIVNGEWGIGNKRQTTNNKIRFQVEDTGIGMTREQMEKIFLPFEQAGDSSRRSEGTGLGLAISHKIVTMMGSKIFVESTPGVGSTFWFDLDLPEFLTHFEPKTLISVNNIIGYQGEKRKILVVDDRWENRAVITKMLEPLGFDLVEASNGQEGLEKAIEIQPHLIIADLMMPTMDGFELTKQLRQLPEFQTTTVIATSASVFEGDRQKSREFGCNDFLPKPVQAEELLKIIEESLDLIWIFADNPKPSSPSLEDKSNPCTQVMLTEMAMPPSYELITLYKAAQIGDFAVVEHAALRFKQLAVEYIPFATMILELAQEFEAEKIMQLIEPHVSEPVE